MTYTIRKQVVKDPHTYVELEGKVMINGDEVPIIGQGFAKRNQRDTPNKQVGLELAIERAVADIRQKRSRIKNVSK